MRDGRYSEGTVFNVPLKGGGYARGVIAREARDILFGYFFGPRLPDEEFEIRGFRPEVAVLTTRFSPFGLISGEWKVIGQIQEWNRELWPLPDFVRYDPLGMRKPRLIRYSEADLAHSEVLGIVEEDVSLSINSLSSSGAVEIKLAKILDDNQV